MVDSTNEIFLNVAVEVIKIQAKQQALIEVMLDKGLISAEEFDDKANSIFQSIKYEKVKELLELTSEEAVKFNIK